MSQEVQVQDRQMVPIQPFTLDWLKRLKGAMDELDHKLILKNGVQVTSSQLTAIRQFKADLRRSLLPSSSEEAALEIAKLIASYQPPADRDALTGEARAEAYMEAIKGRPLWAIREAYAHLLDPKWLETPQGRKFSTIHAPLPAQFGVLVWSLVEPVRVDLWTLGQIEVAAGGRDPEKLSAPEERSAFVSRVLAESGFGELARKHGESGSPVSGAPGGARGTEIQF